MGKLNNTLLINRINPENYSNEKKKVFFLLERPNTVVEEDRIIEIISNLPMLEKIDIVHKYNGVELNIKIKDIPKIIKNLSKNDIGIYSVFETYNPEL